MLLLCSVKSSDEDVTLKGCNKMHFDDSTRLSLLIILLLIYSQRRNKNNTTAATRKEEKKTSADTAFNFLVSEISNDSYSDLN
jgi:hypothetical protein